jgi:hypothetical protein
MNKVTILQKFTVIDENLNSSARVCLYGSGAFILLDEEDRTSLDLDIAGPYSKVDYTDFTHAARAAGSARCCHTANAYSPIGALPAQHSQRSANPFLNT